MSLSSDSRASPFTVKEFSDLVSSAFNLQGADPSAPSQRPILSLTPPSPHPSSSSDTGGDCTSGGCHESETDDEHGQLRSPSLDDASLELSPPDRRSRSRTTTALRVFHQVRTRASAFVLGPRAPSVPRSSSPVPFEPLPPLSISPTLVPSSIIPLRAPSPLSMVDLNLERPPSRPRSRAESLPRTLFVKRERNAVPPPLPTRQTRPSTSTGAPSASPALRSFFDDSPVKSSRAYSRPSTSASTVHPLSRMTTSSSAHAVLSTEGLPSFFEDSGYKVANPAAPHYSRPTTPVGGAPSRIHTRLPPLRKAKSGGHGLFSRGNRKENVQENMPVGLGYDGSTLWGTQHDPRAPSPFTCPREAPPVPDHMQHMQMYDGLDDVDAPLPPSYVFERRGSATSNSTASTRSSSSLSSKISSIVGIAFPSKMRLQARSKLNLSIATGREQPSAHSSPSTMSSLSSPTTPVSPTSAFPRSKPYVFPGTTEFHGGDEPFLETEEDSLAIGRVLTPEADPFAKAEIAVPVAGTPRPPTPPPSRRVSSQTSPPFGLRRTPTWDEDRGRIRGAIQKARNSLPASPVSSASTFPSSCSVYPDREPGSFTQPPPTPKRNAPPSAWSPYSTPAATSSSPRSAATSASSPARPISSPSQSERRRISQSPPSPIISAFPLPPRTLPPFLPPALPPPDRALPPLPSPPAPPVPPKDAALSRVARAHKSLPPSPHTPQSPKGSPSSVRSYRETPSGVRQSDNRRITVLSLGRGMRDLFPEAHAELYEEALAERDNVPPSVLEAPWPGCTSGASSAPPSSQPGWEIRPVLKRRSVDSTSTVTASPSSSALHDAVRGWESETSTVSERPPTLRVEVCSDTANSASSHVLPASGSSVEGDSDGCSSAASLATFYSALSSLGPASPLERPPSADSGETSP